MSRVPSWTFFLAALGLAGVGLYSFLYPAPDLPAFVVSNGERNLGNQPVGKSILAFDITNRSDVPRRVLGLAEG